MLTLAILRPLLRNLVCPCNQNVHMKKLAFKFYTLAVLCGGGRTAPGPEGVSLAFSRRKTSSGGAGATLVSLRFSSHRWGDSSAS